MSRLINDWNNDTNLHFLRLYFNETVLWDPRQRQHKDKPALIDAWNRISKDIGAPVTELRKKRESLMATFRSHVRKKKAAAQYNDVYNPSWFAYELMESYLGPVYDLAGFAPDNLSENSLEGSIVKTEPEEEVVPLATDDCGSMLCQPSMEASSSPNLRQPAKKRRKAFEASDKGPFVTYDNGTFSPVPHPALAHPPHHDPYADDDECELFCRLLSKKLRKLPETERELFMYQIDGMFISRMKQMNRPPSPTLSYAVPSPAVQHNVD